MKDLDKFCNFFKEMGITFNEWVLNSDNDGPDINVTIPGATSFSFRKGVFVGVVTVGDNGYTLHPPEHYTKRETRNLGKFLDSLEKALTPPSD